MYFNQSIVILYQTYKKSLGKGSGWIIDSVRDHNNISNYNLWAGRSYIKLPKELNHPKKRLINIQNINDNKCFKSCLVRYFHPACHNPSKITKARNDFARELDSTDIKFHN